MLLMMIMCRFCNDGLWRDKITTPVNFPVERLDMSRYISGPKQRAPYNLFAVSVCWCFVCFKQKLVDDEWFDAVGRSSGRTSGQ